MVLGMLLALFAATLARGDASLQKRPGDASVVGRLAADHSESGGADIGAVPAQSDALDHLGQVLLAQVIVRVSEASLGAVAERIEGGSQHTSVAFRVPG